MNSISSKEVLGPEGNVDHASVRRKYNALTRALLDRQVTISTMESCTAGQIASLITDTEGSSAILKAAYVTYSNEAKVQAGVPRNVIDEFGVYSIQTALAMAQACRTNIGADIGVGITGSFGNVDPNNDDSTPGEVFFAISTAKGTQGFHCTVPPQDSRLSYKLYMADVVADSIMSVL